MNSFCYSVNVNIQIVVPEASNYALYGFMVTYTYKY